MLKKMPERLRALAGDGGRFLVAGGINTLFGIALYQVLLFWMSEKIALTISWLIGILIFSWVYPKLVFKHGRLTAGRFSLNVAYYLLSYCISLGLLSIYVDCLDIHPRLAYFLVLVFTVPLNFFCSRFIFTMGKN